MSRLDPDTNQWLCKIVLFGPMSQAGLDLSQKILATLSEEERTLYNSDDTPNDHTLAAKYQPSSSNLADIQPIYSLHMLRSIETSAADRQFLLGNVDGVILIVDTQNLEASTTASRELERFLGMYGKMISKLPVVVLADTPLSEEQLQTLNANDLSVFAAESETTIQRAISTLIDRLEQESGLAGISFDLDDIEEKDSDFDWDDVEFDDLHAYDDDDEA